MTFKNEEIVSLVRGFFAAYPPKMAAREQREEDLCNPEVVASSDKLLRLSETISELFREGLPSVTVLQRAGELFDEIAASRWPTDGFGERYEICSSLAFLAWRHASGLGLNVESQEWLRVADLIAEEPFAALECIEAFFALPPELQTRDRARQFLYRPDDVFLALASLRRDRNLNPRRALQGGTIIYEVCLDAHDLPHLEREFFLGESAWLAGHGGRYLGRRTDSSNWLTLAVRHFDACGVREPLLAKARLAFSVAARDRHDLTRARVEVQGLATQFTSWNMNREALICQLMECLVDKEAGAIEEALSGFEILVNRLRQCCELDLLAAALAPYAELTLKHGETNAALKLLEEAMNAASGKPILEGTVYISMAEFHLELGNEVAALLWCRAGVVKVAGAGCTGTLAYYRVWLADLLLRSNRLDEAHQELMLATPILKAEAMVHESIYAATLLAEINSRRSFDVGTQDPPLRKR